LDFNEYLLTKNLDKVIIILENENWWNFNYEWEIYTRSPIINEEWKYTVTIKIIDDVSDLILWDDNSNISVLFTVDSTSQRIPYRCFKNISDNNWILTLRDWDIVIDKELWIKYKWNWWINIDKLALFWLEKKEEKDWIESCIEDWNNIIKNWDNDPLLYNDESLIQWRNEFNNLEDLCREFIKVNPMYWTGHRNAAIVSELWWSWKLIEVLCKIE